SDPQSIAIWSDATTCVDLGDLVCRSFSGKLNGFFEAKAGAMNDRILPQHMVPHMAQCESVTSTIFTAERHLFDNRKWAIGTKRFSPVSIWHRCRSDQSLEVLRRPQPAAVIIDPILR